MIGENNIDCNNANCKMLEYETVIGLEVHIELATNTKIFCGCSTTFGEEENVNICPVCTGMPGSLPVLNKKVVEYAIAVGLALHGNITPITRFDRKNYFYPDNPQGYQISQLYFPIVTGGFLTIQGEDGNKNIRIHELHMEEDAGKLIHDEKEKFSYIDFNRSGVPLIEIVTEPDMRSAGEVMEFLETLKSRIQYLGVSDCKLQEGSMRVDVNLSVRKKGDTKLGTRTEMKNLNSFRGIQRAIADETKRQIALLEAGKVVERETRRWDDTKGTSYSMRSKEDAMDYRYFPEPDLPPVIISNDWIEKIKKKEPEFREEKIIRYQSQYGISEYDSRLLTETKEMAACFEETIVHFNQPKEVANWLMVETLSLLKEKGLDSTKLLFSPKQLASLLTMIYNKVINRTVAKEVFEAIFGTDLCPVEYVAAHNLSMIQDEERIIQIVEQVIGENEQSVQDYIAGKKRAMGFLVGQVMKATKGKADPQKVNELVQVCLERFIKSEV